MILIAISILFTMNNEQILNSSIIVTVALLHAALMSFLFQIDTTKQLTLEHIEFVDLGDFGGGNGKAEDSNLSAQAAVLAPSHSTAQDHPNLISEIKEDKIEENEKKIEEKEIEEKEEEAIIQPVIIKKADTDIKQTKLTLKIANKSKPKPKSIEKEKPKAQTFSSYNRTSNNDRNINKERDGQSQEESKSGNSNSQGEGGSKTGKGAGDGNNSAGTSPNNPIKTRGSIPKPPYPQISQENGEEGTVVLSVLVAPGGRVSDVKVSKSSGHSRLDRSAHSAAKDGHFATNVWTEYHVSVRFQLR